jgi:ribosomal protein S6E (S10)
LIDYYKEVVIADEKRFLDREVAEWFKGVELGTVEGDRKVIIKGGKSLTEVPEGAMGVWREFKKRGDGEK